MKVWASYARNTDDHSWHLKSVSTSSPERARALLEQHLARSGTGSAELLVREFESIGDVPWHLDDGAVSAASAA